MDDKSKQAALTQPVHGTAPLNVVEKIVRGRVMESQYWREKCFGLNEVTLVDRAAELEEVGGVMAENNKPTPFLCLVVKMLQMMPKKNVVDELLRNGEFKYLRALAAFFVRLTGSPKEIYSSLEPLYMDYSKIRLRSKAGWDLITLDGFVDTLLTEDFACDISLPRLPDRLVLERNDLIQPYQSPLLAKLLSGKDGNDDETLSTISDISCDIGATVSIDESNEGFTQSMQNIEVAVIQDVEDKVVSSVKKRSRSRSASESSIEDRKHSKMGSKKSKKEKKEKKSKKERRKEKEKIAKDPYKRKIFIKGLKGAPSEGVSQSETHNDESIEAQNALREKLGLKPLA